MIKVNQSTLTVQVVERSKTSHNHLMISICMLNQDEFPKRVFRLESGGVNKQVDKCDRYACRRSLLKALLSVQLCLVLELIEIELKKMIMFA